MVTKKSAPKKDKTAAKGKPTAPEFQLAEKSGTEQEVQGFLIVGIGHYKMLLSARRIVGGSGDTQDIVGDGRGEVGLMRLWGMVF